MSMNLGRKTLACLLLSYFGLVVGVYSVVNDSAKPADKETDSNTNSLAASENPYATIALRNIFDLKPPPPPPIVEPPKTNAPPSNVKLTGITTILGKKQAFFMVQRPPLPGKPPEKELSYILEENQRRDALEVVSIDTKTKMVTIKNDGLLSTITFETNKTGGGAAPGPGIRPGFPPPTAPGMNNPGFPARQIRTGAPTAFQSGNNYNQSGATANANVYQSGAAPINTAGSSGGGTSLPGLFSQPPPSMQATLPVNIPNVEEQVVQTEVQRAFYQNSSDPKLQQIANILPPTQVYQGNVLGANQNQNQNPNQNTQGNPQNQQTTPNPFLAPRGTGTFRQ